jgi:hypothetical protein
LNHELPEDSGHPALRPYGPGCAVRAAPAAQSPLRGLIRPTPLFGSLFDAFLVVVLLGNG